MEAAAGGRPTGLWIAAAWCCAGLFYATETVVGMRAEGMHHAWALLFLTDFLHWLPWALATPLILRAGARGQHGRRGSWRFWLGHAAAVLAIQSISAAWRAGMLVLLNPYAGGDGPGGFFELWFGAFYGGFFAAVLLYAVIAAAGHILADRDRLSRQQTETARLNEQLSQARFEVLRRQIEPHFLFNSLNSIAALVRENHNAAAVTMIARLSDFLRRVIHQPDRQLSSLGEELDFLAQYLEIQKVRFSDRLQFRMDVPGELLGWPVPALLLQPMVENAIKHGIGKRAEGGAIRISAARADGSIRIGIYNDGPGLPADWDEGKSGVGFSVVRARLRGLYGDAGGLSVRNSKPGGVEVSITVPAVQS